MDESCLITAIGNPNVDLIVIVNETYLFEKYNLSVDGHLPANAEILDKVKDDIIRRNYKTIYTPGGCAQNTLRVIQWLVGASSKCAMIGSIGGDEEANYMVKEMTKAGVKTLYTKLENYRTASVIIIVYEKNRSALYGFNMGAASMYTVPMLFKNEEAISTIKKSKIIHLEAFFTVHSLDVGLELIKLCSDSDIITSFNLCGEYVLRKDKNAVIPFVDACEIVIGNLVEFCVLCKELGINHDDTEHSAKQLYHRMTNNSKNTKKYAIKSFEKYVKILIITNGNNPLFCITKSDGFIKYHVSPMESSKIVDTTGAGDAFLGGFLYGILHDAPITSCLDLGHKMAVEIIQNHGCVLPNIDPATFTGDL